ncbi:MAG: hypothetical protein ABIQ03_11620 [Burkholderiales bacterium]
MKKSETNGILISAAMQYFEDIAVPTKVSIVSSYVGNPVDLYLAQPFAALHNIFSCCIRTKE